MTSGFDFASAMEKVAKHILGEPNEALSSADELRFGSRGSMAVQIAGEGRGTYYDNEAGEGGGVLDLIRTHKHFVNGAALDYMRSIGINVPAPTAQKRIVAAYDYFDADGALVFQVVRLEPKSFRQRRPDGKGGWVWGVKGVQTVLYRLADIAAAPLEHPVFVVEGEKDADALCQLGMVATCNPGGAGKWRARFNASLRGRKVVILPDNDHAGAEHAGKVAKALQGVAASIQVINLPGLPAKGDACDWIAAGGTAAAMIALVEATPEHAPTTDPGQSAAGFEELTEHGVAMVFALERREQLRYCHHAGAWYVWVGSHWQKNETKLAFTWSRHLVAKLNRESEMKVKAITGRASFAASVERFAQADQALAVVSSQWDQDLYLLGTPGGTVDLRSGQIRTARPSDYITRITAVTPAETPDCPIWLEFLDQATGHDQGLVRFLRQWAGYSLTGDTREQALLFVYGPGGNGKGVFQNTTARVTGDYARIAPMDTFTASAGDKHPTDLAMLRGARSVVASETEEGRAWAESRIKQMTGGDTISARFMRQDFFEYLPQFKLTIIGNHKPRLNNVDEAARRRFNMVSFTYKPPRKDLDLEAKLRAEWPAILRWMIEGCLDWQRHGLVRPKVVIDATNEYFEAQDHFGRWMAECCDLVPTFSTRPSHLLHSFQKWCASNGEPESDNRKLSGMLERTQGIKFVKNNGTRFVRGIALKPDRNFDPTGENER